MMLRRLIFCIAAAGTAACAPSPPRSATRPPSSVLEVRGGVRWYGRSFLRERDGILEARFSGAPYERGYARGMLAYPQIVAGENDLDALMRRMVPSRLRRWT